MNCLPCSSSTTLLPTSESSYYFHHLLSDLHLSQCLISLIRGKPSFISHILQTLSTNHLSPLQKSIFYSLSSLYEILTLTKTNKFSSLFMTMTSTASSLTQKSRKRKKEKQKTIFNVAQPLVQAFESLKCNDYLHSIQCLQHGYFFLTQTHSTTPSSSSHSSSQSTTQSLPSLPSPTHHLLLHIYRTLLSSFYLFQGDRKKSFGVLFSLSLFKAEKSSSLHQLLTFNITTWFAFFQGDLQTCQELISSSSSSSSFTSPPSSSMGHLSSRFFSAMVSLCSKVSDLFNPSSISSSSSSSSSSPAVLDNEFKLQCRDDIASLLFVGHKFLQLSISFSPLLILSLYFTAYTALFLLSQTNSFLIHVTHQGGGIITRLEELSRKILLHFKDLSTHLPLIKLLYHSLVYKLCVVHQNKTKSARLSQWIRSSDEYDLNQLLLELHPEPTHSRGSPINVPTPVTSSWSSSSTVLALRTGSAAGAAGGGGGFALCYLLYFIERARYDTTTPRINTNLHTTSPNSSSRPCPTLQSPPQISSRLFHSQINLMVRQFGLNNPCKSHLLPPPSSGHILFDLSFLQPSHPLQ
jgi:hypothetical protein